VILRTPLQSTEIGALVSAGLWQKLRKKALVMLRHTLDGSDPIVYKKAAAPALGVELELGRQLRAFVRSEALTSDDSLVINFNTDSGDFQVSVGRGGPLAKSRSTETNVERELIINPSIYDPISEALSENGQPYLPVSYLFLSALGSAISRAELPSLTVRYQHHDADDDQTLTFQGGSGEPISYPPLTIGPQHQELSPRLIEEPQSLRTELEAVTNLDTLVQSVRDPILNARLVGALVHLGLLNRLKHSTLHRLAANGNFDVLHDLIRRLVDGKTRSDSKIIDCFIKLLSDPYTSDRIRNEVLRVPEAGARLVPSLLTTLRSVDYYTGKIVVELLLAIDRDGTVFRGELLTLMDSSKIVLKSVLAALEETGEIGPGIKTLWNSINRHLNSPDWFTRQRILDVAVKQKSLVIPLENLQLLLRDEHEKVRISAGRLFASRFAVTDKTESIFEELLRDVDLVVGNVIQLVAAAPGAEKLDSSFDRLRGSANQWLKHRVQRALENRAGAQRRES
jgi:hypothetical protein